MQLCRSSSTTHRACCVPHFFCVQRPVRSRDRGAPVLPFGMLEFELVPGNVAVSRTCRRVSCKRNAWQLSHCRTKLEVPATVVAEPHLLDNTKRALLKVCDAHDMVRRTDLFCGDTCRWRGLARNVGRAAPAAHSIELQSRSANRMSGSAATIPAASTRGRCARGQYARRTQAPCCHGVVLLVLIVLRSQGETSDIDN